MMEKAHSRAPRFSAALARVAIVWAKAEDRNDPTARAQIAIDVTARGATTRALAWQLAAIARARDLGMLAVEMEAAALYAFSATSGHPVVCFAHVTNQMGRIEQDFEILGHLLIIRHCAAQNGKVGLDCGTKLSAV